MWHAVDSESSTPDVTAARTWQRGRSFEDFAVGDVYRHHWGRTITEADAVAFATQTLQYNPIYLNAERARELGHPGLVVSPYLVLALVVGLSVEDLSERSEAFLGLTDVEFGDPVYTADTISSTSTVEAVRTSRSNPRNGIVTWRTEGQNQHGRPVVTFQRSNLFQIGGSSAAD